jgi:uncharacterized protein (UPF0332 family)
MKNFEEYVLNKDVKKQAPDVHTAKATARDSLERLEMAKAILLTQKPKYVLENAYEAVRELIDAILYAEGYKSYSHEASISYLALLHFSITEITKLDKLRRYRNGIKYYGEEVTLEEAKDALQTAETIIHKLTEKKKGLFLQK